MTKGAAKRNKWNEIRLLYGQPIIMSILYIGCSFLLFYFVFELVRLGRTPVVDIYLIFAHIRRYAYIHFTMISLVSLLFYSLEKDNVAYEITYRYRKIQYKKRTQLLCLWVLGFAVLLSLFIIGFSLIKVDHELPRWYIVFLLLQILYDYWGVGFLGVLLGRCISYSQSKVGRIVWFTITQFLLGYPFMLVCEMCVFSKTHNRVLAYMLDLLAVLPDGYQYGPADSYSIIFVQPHHIAVLLCWYFGLGCIICFMEAYYRRALISVLMGAVCIIIVCLPWTANYPGHRRADEMSWISYSPITNEEWLDVNASGDPLVEAPVVQKYDIHLFAYLFPIFHVSMEFEQSICGTVDFTLHKGMEITGIYDAKGQPLVWERNGNYVQINILDITEQISMDYYGNVGAMCADASALFLKPGIPYFPMSGKRVVYDESDFYRMKYWEMNRLENRPYFHIKVNTVGDVISSLPETGHNEFSGEADAIFLLHGMYAEYEYEGIRIIYPYAAEQVLSPRKNEEVRAYFDFYMQEIDTEKKTKIILLGFINSINTRELEMYDAFTCIDTLYYFEDRREQIEEYLRVEGLL